MIDLEKPFDAVTLETLFRTMKKIDIDLKDRRIINSSILRNSTSKKLKKQNREEIKANIRLDTNKCIEQVRLLCLSTEDNRFQ